MHKVFEHLKCWTKHSALKKSHKSPHSSLVWPTKTHRALIYPQISQSTESSTRSSKAQALSQNLLKHWHTHKRPQSSGTLKKSPHTSGKFIHTQKVCKSLAHTQKSTDHCCNTQRGPQIVWTLPAQIYHGCIGAFWGCIRYCHGFICLTHSLGPKFGHVKPDYHA